MTLPRAEGSPLAAIGDSMEEDGRGPAWKECKRGVHKERHKQYYATELEPPQAVQRLQVRLKGRRN